MSEFLGTVVPTAAPPPVPAPPQPPWYYPATKHHPAPPSPQLGKLLDCIAHNYGQPIFYNSTSEFDPKVGHLPNTPHGRGEAADIEYPTDPEKLLCAAKGCGAGYTRDELLYPSAMQNGPHVMSRLAGEATRFRLWEEVNPPLIILGSLLAANNIGEGKHLG